MLTMFANRGDRHGPPIVRRISALLSKRLTTWQTLVITLLWLYVARNFGKLVNLECPEPLANLYSRSYFRATWVTTALDAGFWSAMRVRRKWLRDFLSMVFSVYYMVCAEQADEKVRKVRGCLTVEHLRVSWNKGTSPYLAFATNLLRPRLMRYPPRAIRIPRPDGSSYKEPVHAWLYFDGPLSALKKHHKLVLDVPGGGFVAMTPRHHDDKLIAWAGKTGLPILSLDYKKAPEFPYPYALNECYDVYQTIVATQGRCVGFLGDEMPKIIVSGDSAGGNLAVGMTLMILQSGSTDTRRWQGEVPLPAPESLVLIYPALDMNIGNWMTDEQMALIRDRRVRKTNEGILRRKSDDYRKLAPDTPHVSSDEDEEHDGPTPDYLSSKSFHKLDSQSVDAAIKSPSTVIHLSAGHTGQDSTSAYKSQEAVVESKPQMLKTRIAISSMISYFNDRILTPEMMRAMIVLYIGPQHRPDFSTDFLLSPVLAPEALLADFPKTYFLTGERDPLVDDTVIFAGRIRQAKQARLLERKELGLEREKTPFWEHEHVEVLLIPGISHGFLQFVSLFPEGWKYIFKCARWMKETFDRVDREEDEAAIRRGRQEERGEYFEEDPDPLDSTYATPSTSPHVERTRHHFRTRTESSGDDDRPLEMTLRNSIHGTPTRRGKDNGHVRSSTGGDRVRLDAASLQMRNGEGSGRARGRRPTMKGRKKSLVGLASSDDLLGRRMKGLTGGLMGNGDGPPTP